METYNDKLKKLATLGKEFLDLSENIHGWNNTVIFNEDGNYSLGEGHDTSIARLYFATGNNYTDFSFGNKISVGYFSPVHFKIQGYIDLDEVYKEYLKILESIKAGIEKINKDEIEIKRQEQINELEFRLQKLKK